MDLGSSALGALAGWANPNSDPTGASRHQHPTYSAANPEVRPRHTAARKSRSNVSILSLGLW